MTINTNEDFRNNFNSGWASKLIIGVDEVLLDKKEDAERIKNLSTTRSIKSEAKGKDKIEQEFYGKFILCSNNESSFIKIHPKETRFWIRKIPIIKDEDNKFKEKMREEIPAFLYYLSNRDIVSEDKTRMWFRPEELYTDALKRVIFSAKSKLEKEIKNLIIEQFHNFDSQEINFTPKDILELLKSENNYRNAQKSDIIKIISEKWGYKPKTKPSHYNRYEISITGTISKTSNTGRYYTFYRNEFIKEDS